MSDSLEGDALNVGTKIRDLRKTRGFTQSELAEESGLSTNTLSMIERGVTSPNLITLQKIATALRLDINNFFDPTPLISQVSYLKTYQRSPIPLADGKMSNLASGFPDAIVAPILLELNPGARTEQDVTHDGQEFVFCLRGQLLYIVGTRAYLLEAGDSLLFDGSRPHRWQNAGAVTTEALLIICHTEEEMEILKQHFLRDDLETQS
ncbi:MAG: helix-turn-helix domain-containing protein [Anaerolineales bacterium]